MTSRITPTSAQSAQPAQQQTTTEVVPEERRCQYSSKRCENPRTYKKSGQLHTFCSYHREKANRNQMRVDRRRRRQRSPTANVTPTGNAAAAGMGLAAPRARAAHRTVKPAMTSSWGVYPSSIKLDPPLAIRINHNNADPAAFMLTDEDVLMFEQMAASPTSASYMPPVVAPSPTGPALFNDEDLFILQSLLFSDEESQSPEATPYYPQQEAWCSGSV